MKKYCFIYLLLTIISSQNIFADSRNTTIESGIVDCGAVLCHSGKKWEDEIIPKEWAGEIVTKVFTNKSSGHKLYYEGADGWGSGNYYIVSVYKVREHTGTRQEILYEHNRQKTVRYSTIDYYENI